VYERNSGLKFFSRFLGLSLPVLAKNNTGKRFFNFLIFLLFLWNFLARVVYERNLVLKFLSHFLGLSYPVLAKNNTRKWFFNFLIFLLFFSEFSCPGRI